MKTEDKNSNPTGLSEKNGQPPKVNYTSVTTLPHILK